MQLCSNTFRVVVSFLTYVENKSVALAVPAHAKVLAASFCTLRVHDWRFLIAPEPVELTVNRFMTNLEIMRLLWRLLRWTPPFDLVVVSTMRRLHDEHVFGATRTKLVLLPLTHGCASVYEDHVYWWSDRRNALESLC